MARDSLQTTSRSLSVEQLRVEVEHLRLAQEAGEIGTWEWDLATDRMKWSTQMFRNLGAGPRAGGDSLEVLIKAVHPADRDMVESAFAQFRTLAGPLRFEFRVVGFRKETRWIVLRGKVEPDAAGVPNRARGVAIDSTRRRSIEVAAESALRESERRLLELNERLEQLAERRARQLLASRAQIQAIFENSPDWLTLFRAAKDGRFIYEDLNRATERAYGRSYDEVVGHTVEEILGVEQAQLPLHHMRECIRTGENQRYTARRTFSAGVTRTVDVMFVRVPELHEGDYFIMSTARDLTEREAMEERLRQSQKMEAVGQLTGGLAHDFNNLLTAIIGNLELLEARVAGDTRAASYLGGAQRAAENGAKLTEQLLAFSRRQHLQPRAIDLNGVIGGMRDLLARTIGSNIHIHTRLNPELWRALVDPTQIEIAILNLAINARDAMPLGGNLTIETRNLISGIDALPGEIGDRDCICISVRDTGTGMTEEVLRSAVEPFFTTKEVGKGSGLGLSQVYGMVRQSNGTLQIDSRPGAGTAVHLYLPRAEAHKTGHTEPGNGARLAEGGRILVVDDDDGVREVTVQMLRQIGYGVAEVDGGEAALAALARGEIYDLVVIDLAMPGLNGAETVRRARERWPGLRVLYVTGYADLAGNERRTGADPLIKKPFRLEELRAAVRRALRKSRAGEGKNVVPLRKRGQRGKEISG
jgi:PAS domain S-box-containing protein